MTEREQRRIVNHRLAVLQHAEEVTGNVAQTCRYYGISRPTFYKWRNRYEEKGLEGLRVRSSRPHHSPGATNAEVVGTIIYLRQTYHFGPAKISMYLKRYHDVRISPSGGPVGCFVQVVWPDIVASAVGVGVRGRTMMNTENEVTEFSTPLVPVDVLDGLMAQVESEGAEWAPTACCPR